MPDPTIAGIHVLDILDAMKAVGLDPAGLCAAAGLDLEALRVPEVRLPGETAMRIFTAAERLTGDPVIGLHAGGRAQPRGPLIYLLMSSPRLEDGMRQVARFSRLTIDTLRMSGEVEGEHASMMFDFGAPVFERSRHPVDYLLMATVRSIRRVIGEGFRLDEVRFRHADGGTRAEVEHAFGCAARFEQPDNRIVYPRRELEATSPFGNPRIAEQIEKFASLSVPASSLCERVASVARQLLVAGYRADTTSVARRVGMSERSLQRGLRDERATFRTVRDAAVREVVEALLTNPRLKLDAVALSVGFADGAALAKAVKRWTGRSPAEYRKLLAGELHAAAAPVVPARSAPASRYGAGTTR
ncbi:MAG TPA: AraC family transcriptional regulator [Candidatus Eisenbacteria bacterium]|nr:AraC family transcriptional regulator [Candidatus Eisenbacteria bacterium]